MLKPRSLRNLVMGGSLLLLAAWSGCGTNFAEWLGFRFGDAEPQVARLRAFTSEAELKNYLVGQNNSFSRGIIVDFDSGESLAGDGAAPPNAPAPDANGAGGSDDSSTQDYSTTTEQEEGVQESDVVKSDGNYFYIISRNNLRIVDAVPADAMSETASFELNGYGYDLYLAGDRIIALTSPEQPVYLEPDAPSALIAPDFAPYRPQVEITVIDANDRAKPQVLSRTRIDGYVNASRMIDDRLYLVIVNYPDAFVQPLLDGQERREFADVSLSDILPDMSVEVNGTVVYRGNINSYDEHFRPEAEDGLGLTSLVTFDINAPKDYDAQTIVAYPANIYASTKALYLTDTAYDFNGDFRETTDIYKFDFTGTGIAQAATGTIPGRVLNQYSMSEYQGYLRVAATKAATFGPIGQTAPSSNYVYVLEQVNDELTLAGSIENLAPGETIFSARFIGTKGYLVTFERIDPLFTLDLSDPRDPKAVGELKVPGFSTFIVPMDENHLLTVGQDTDEAFGFANGVRLSVFDVSDFTKPVLAHHTVIGLDGSAYSDALWNPKAFTYFPEGDLVALPINYYAAREFVGGLVDVDEGSSGSGGSGSDGVESVEPSSNAAEPQPDAPPPADVPSNGEDPTDDPADPPVDVIIDLPAPEPIDSFSGLYVYHVTAAEGFKLRGRIATSSNSNGFYWYGPEFIRGAFIGDSVYCITSDDVKSASVTAVDTVLSTVNFPAPEWIDDYPYPLPVDGVITTNAE